MVKELRSPMIRIGFLSLLLIIMILFITLSCSASSANTEPGHTGPYTGDVDLWYMSQHSYRKAGLNIENPNNELKIVTGITMAFNLSESPGYMGKVIVQRGELGEDKSAKTEHNLEGFSCGNEIEQNFLFQENEYLIVDSNYNLQFRPLHADHIELLYLDDEEGNSHYWDPNTGDWATSSEALNSPDIQGKSWAVNALVEPVPRLTCNMRSTNQIISPDAVDAFFTDLQMGNTYVFKMTHSSTLNFQMSVYRDRNAKGFGGKICEENLIASTSGSEGPKEIMITPDYTGRHYIIVKPRGGSGIYEVEFFENRPPVAEAGDDICANMIYGERIDLTFENILSYDPDDDTNGNGEMDGREYDDLEYYWDFDLSDDIPDNLEEADAKGKIVNHTFERGGKYEITLIVADPYGAMDSDTLELLLNYIPVVNIGVKGDDDGNIYVDEKILFSGENSYDPDDDQNCNGRIDASEIDNIMYYWDFNDRVDRDRDGNYTNDIDASNKMWYFKYDEPDIYTVTLNVRDNPDQGISAHNFSHVKIKVLDKPLPVFETPMESDNDTTKDTETNEDVTDDVAVREVQEPDCISFMVGGYSGINIRNISVENIKNTLIMTLTTWGNIIAISSEADVFYHFYIVRRPFYEPNVDDNSLASIDIFYMYNFTFHNDKLTIKDSSGSEIRLIFEYSLEVNALTIRVPVHELTLLAKEVEEEDGETDLFDIFGVSTYSSMDSGAIVKKYARDSMGTCADMESGSRSSDYPDKWFDKDIDPKIIEEDAQDEGNNNILIIGISLGSAALLAISFTVIIWIRKRRSKHEGYREYVIAEPPGPSSGFTVRGMAQPIHDPVNPNNNQWPLQQPNQNHQGYPSEWLYYNRKNH